MLIEQAEKVHYSRQRSRLSAFVAREGVVSAARQACRRDLAQSELPSDPADFLAPAFACVHHQLVPGCRVPLGATDVELDLVAGAATPARQPGDLYLSAFVLDREGLILEPGHALPRSARCARPWHCHLSLNWITGAPSRSVSLM